MRFIRARQMGQPKSFIFTSVRQVMHPPKCPQGIITPSIGASLHITHDAFTVAIARLLGMTAGELVLKPVSNSGLLKLTSDSGTPSSSADLIEAAVAMAISCFSCDIKGTLAVIGDEGGHLGGVALVIDPDKGSIFCSRQRTSRHYESTISSFIYVIIKIPISKLSSRIT